MVDAALDTGFYRVLHLLHHLFRVERYTGSRFAWMEVPQVSVLLTLEVLVEE